MSEDISQYLKNIERIHENILIFIENENNQEENYQNLLQLFNDQKILDNPSEMELILTLISKISDNHCRLPSFFPKLEQILLFFKDSMAKIFSNQKIFTIFSNNQRILLFLFKEGIIKFDINLILNNIIQNDKTLYDKTSAKLKYFLPEIKMFIDNQKFSNNIEEEENEEKNRFVNINELRDYVNQLYQTIVNDEFESKRNLGENDDNICQLIRKDLIEEFIIEYNRKDLSLNMKIPSSIFETNSFLLDKTPTLIQYASFYGSIQIFRFLYKNKVELTSSLWLYAIHSDDSELFSILEDKCPKPESFKDSWIEAVKCHHNSMANYIQNNYSIENCYKFFSFYNFSILANNYINLEIMLYYSCKYNYYNLCEVLLSTTKVNINYFKSTWVDEIETMELHKKIVNYEIKKRLISDKTPFAAACINNNINIIQLLLLDKNVDINLPCSYIDQKKKVQTKTPLYLAVENNNCDVVEILLLRPEIDINCDQVSEKVSKTALYLAVELENIEIVKLFLSHPKIDVNIPKKTKNLYQTALYSAVGLENIEIVKLLLSHPKIDFKKNAMF